MPGCRKEIIQYVPTRFSCKAVKAVCGQTGIYGDPIFCVKCSEKYKDRDWQAEARANGENYDEEY